MLATTEGDDYAATAGRDEPGREQQPDVGRAAFENIDRSGLRPPDPARP
jgi:hypothetical protein